MNKEVCVIPRPGWGSSPSAGGSGTARSGSSGPETQEACCHWGSPTSTYGKHCLRLFALVEICKKTHNIIPFKLLFYMNCPLNVLPAYVMHNTQVACAFGGCYIHNFTHANVQLHFQVVCIQVACNCTVNIECLCCVLSTGSVGLALCESLIHGCFTSAATSIIRRCWLTVYHVCSP